MPEMQKPPLRKSFELPPLQWTSIGMPTRGRCAIALFKGEGNQFSFPPIHKLDEYTDSCWPCCPPCIAEKASPQFNAQYFSEPLNFNKLMQMRMMLKPFKENSIGYRRMISRARLAADTFCMCAESRRVGCHIGDASKMKDLVTCSNHTINVNGSVIHQASTTIRPHHNINPVHEANKMLKPSRRFFGHPTINPSKFPFPPAHLYDKFTGVCWTNCYVCHPKTAIPKFRIRYFEKEAQFSETMEPIQLLRGFYPDNSIHARRLISAKVNNLDI